MEIHAPTSPVESIKDFLIHLGIVTIGVPIAIGLEQTVEAWHHHDLGEQTKANILSEVRDNKREVDGERTVVAENRKQLAQTLDTVRQFLAHQKPEHADMSLKISGASLNSTSWTTAAAAGSLSYVDYATAAKFAKAYEIQALLQRTQEDEFRMVAEPLAIISFNKGGADHLSDDQLRTVEREILDLLATAWLWDQLAAQVGQEYDRVLKDG